MSLNLTVILGAGAALDVVHPTSNQVKDAIYRPPITANLFTTHRNWEDEYSKFPAVVSVVQELRNSLPQNHTSIDVEKFLGWLKDSPNPIRNAQFREFPLYLQRYFTAVSDNYCRTPANYFTLINKIFDLDLGKVVFLTTNYDLLFDKALHHSPATNFSISNPNMTKYISEEKWAYIKLHGSIDWGRRIKEEKIKNKGNALTTLIDNVDQLGANLENSLIPDIIRDNNFNQATRELIYPAISVPVGQSKLNCLEDHVTKLKEHLNNCQNYLVIGFSGFDEDVLNLLNQKEGSFSKILFVSGSEQSANQARDKFINHKTLGQKLQMHTEIYKGNGFDEFIRSSKGLIEYLNKLT